MDISSKALWICGGIGVVAIVCCIALGIAVRSQGQLIDRLQADVRINTQARQAADIAQAMRDTLYQKAESDAQDKAAMLDGISDCSSDADTLARLQRVFGQGANAGDNATGQSACRVPDASGPGSALEGK